MGSVALREVPIRALRGHAAPPHHPNAARRCAMVGADRYDVRIRVLETRPPGRDNHRPHVRAIRQANTDPTR